LDSKHPTRFTPADTTNKCEIQIPKYETNPKYEITNNKFKIPTFKSKTVELRMLRMTIAGLKPYPTLLLVTGVGRIPHGSRL
jgi:hypothetical protein